MNEIFNRQMAYSCKNIYQEAIINLVNLKRQKNDRYSMRSMARDLDVDASDLLNIMKNKKKVTPRIAYRIGLKLELSESELLQFLKPVLMN